MTKQLKKILLLTLFGIFVFTFINCEYDDSVAKEESAIETQRKFNVKKIGYDELIKNKKLANQLNKLSTDKSVHKDTYGKVIYSQDQNFYIDTDFATYIENENGSHSYTFLINRDSTNVKLENLILTSTDSVYYKMYIAQYDITDDELMQLKNGETPDLSTKTILTPINDTELFDSIFSKVLVINSGSGGCVIGVTSIAATYCKDGIHQYGDGSCIYKDATPGMLIYTWGDCTEEGGGGEPIDTTPTTGGSNTSSPPSPPESPCSELRKLLTTTSTKTAIVDLQNKVNYNEEYGWSVKTFSNSYSYASPSVCDSDPKDPKRIYMPTGGDIVGAYHTHPNSDNTGSVHMFSPEDVKWLFRVANRGNKPKTTEGYYSYFLTLTCQRGTYAIKIKDFAKFRAYINPNYLSFKDKLDRKYKEMNGSDATAEKLENALLDFIEGKDMGIGLYKLNASNTNWDELSLNSDPFSSSNSVNKTPCNI